MYKLVMNLLLSSGIFLSCNAMQSTYDLSSPENLVKSIKTKILNTSDNPHRTSSIAIQLASRFRYSLATLPSLLNEKKQSALHIAANLHDENVVRVLLHHTLHTNLYGFLSLQDSDGNTAAHCLVISVPKQPSYVVSSIVHENNCKKSIAAIIELIHNAAGDRVNDLQEILNNAGERYIDYLDSEKTTIEM